MFEKAKWITAYTNQLALHEAKNEKCPYLVKEFYLDKLPVKADLSVIGLGGAAYYLNGIRIPHSIRATYPSNTLMTLFYQTFPVEDLLTLGNNCFGAILGHYRLGKLYSLPENPQKLILQLDLSFADGTAGQIVSDESFRYADSDIEFAYELCGERHNALKVLPDWNRASFDHSGWERCSVAAGPGAVKMRPTECPPIETFEEREGTEIAPSVFDCHVTTSGWVRIKVTGPKGAHLRLYYSEVLKDGGRHVDRTAYYKGVYPDCYNSDEYVLSGQKDEVFEQLMSVHGFRYVEADGPYESLSVTSVTVHTDLKAVSDFSCSCEVFNQIHKACINSMLTCCQHVMVDNPKRDSMWTGDTTFSAESLALNFDVYAMFSDWMVSYRDAELPNGLLPHIVPANSQDCYDHLVGADWDSALFFSVYYSFKYSGNPAIVEENWEAMDRNIGLYLSVLNSDGLNSRGLGDWSAIPEPDCKVEVTSTAHLYLNLKAMAEMAPEIGRDPSPYRKIMQDLKAAFRKKYVADGKMTYGHVTGLLCAVYCDFLEGDEIKDAVQRICGGIDADGGEIRCGVIGYYMIFDVLSRYGRLEYLTSRMLDDTVRGYAKNVRDGLSACTERFDYDKHPMFSLNHYFFSMIERWFYRTLAGIRVKGFGYGSVVIEPHFVKEVEKVDADLHGIHVSYDARQVTVDSPYDFTLILNGKETPCKAGRITAGREAGR